MPRSMMDGSYKEVRGLSRGLQVLRALNFGVGGEQRLGDVAALTGLHRTTVRRLLETLVTQGFVRRSASDDSFRLSLAVRTLSEGFTDDEWIAEVAAPVLGELLREVVWPTDLCTLEGASMVIRESTHRFSPFSLHRAMVGARLPLLFTAAGRAYFGFCPDRERAGLVRQIRADGDPEDAILARSPAALAALIRRTRAAGYGANDRAWSKEPRFSAIALPIRSGDQVLGCLNLVFTARAMTVEEAAARYLGPLRHAVERIAAGVRSMNNGISEPSR